MHIEFDPTKNETNIRDRGLSFERAENFDFDSALICKCSMNPRQSRQGNRRYFW